MDILGAAGPVLSTAIWQRPVKGKMLRPRAQPFRQVRAAHADRQTRIDTFPAAVSC